MCQTKSVAESCEVHASHSRIADREAGKGSVKYLGRGTDSNGWSIPSANSEPMTKRSATTTHLSALGRRQRILASTIHRVCRADPPRFGGEPLSHDDSTTETKTTDPRQKKIASGPAWNFQGRSTFRAQRNARWPHCSIPRRRLGRQ